jgi:hypothetical protein
MCEHEKGRVFQRALCLLTASGPLCYEIELAQGTRSDRKDAKDVILDRLGPRRPWRGTLSSSARVPCVLSLFVAARFTLLEICQQFVGKRFNSPFNL